MADLSQHPDSVAAANEFRCWAEIDLSAIRANARVAQEMTGARGPSVMAVIKANAYGHGAARVGRALECEDCVSAFGVANLEEGIELKQAGIDRPIYVLGPALPLESPAIVESGFRPAVSTFEEAQAFSNAATSLGMSVDVQLVVDTGMGRIGMLPDGMLETAKRIAELPGIVIDSVASHLPSADEDEHFTVEQLERFRELVARLRAAGLRFDQTHVMNSAGTMGYRHAEGELVRPGLMLFGSAPVQELQHRLQPVLALKSRVCLVRDLPLGHGVSYGRVFVTKRPTVAATVSIGYADGVRRRLAGDQGTQVLIHGNRCPLIGRVTMDQIVVDVTELPNRPEVGDEVVLIGKQGDAEILASEMAAKAGTIAWEIFTGIGPRVNRVYR